MNKILIIKLGYSETLNKEISTTTSLGDVLRTTVILHYFKDDNVSWLVDKKAAPLLEKNPFINRLLIYNLETVLQLQLERFDTLINLEKVPGICALADSVDAWRRFGFRFDKNKGIAQSYDGAERVLSLSLNLDEKRQNKKYWQEALAEMIGRRWDKEQEYILRYKPKTKTKYDVGLNWLTGSKWKNKAWPREYWQELSSLLNGKCSVSWQQGSADLYEYMDWMNSCSLLITNDSLGMHLAIAMRKKIIALFGPSSSKEVYLYNRGKILLPEITPVRDKPPQAAAASTEGFSNGVNYDCIPCLKRECSKRVHCMRYIKPERVSKETIKMLNNYGPIKN